MVVLVSVKHDDSIGQGKAGITIGKWGAITVLKNQRQMSVSGQLYPCYYQPTGSVLVYKLDYQPENGQVLANSLTKVSPWKAHLVDSEPS